MSTTGNSRPVFRLLAGGYLVCAFSMPALAANQQHYVVRDFTGYCAVLDSHPSR